MDLIDLKAGQSVNYFWFRGKRFFIDRLIKLSSMQSAEILVIGAGVGEDLCVINKFGNVTAVDINSEALKHIPSGSCTRKIKADACRLPFHNNVFDLILSFDVFEHIETDKEAFKEAFRVLRPGGKLIFSVPAYQWLFGSHDVILGHKRRYSMRLIKSRLKLFSVERLGYWNTFFFPICALLRLFYKRSKPKLNHYKLPKFIQNVLTYSLYFESILIQYGFYFPWGLSIFGIVKKNKK